MITQILENAKLDLIDGFYFYEEQQEQLGHYFLDCLYSDIDSLLLYAGIHKRKHDFFWMLSKRFPYAVYYEKEESIIRIHAILFITPNAGAFGYKISSNRKGPGNRIRKDWPEKVVFAGQTRARSVTRLASEIQVF